MVEFTNLVKDVDENDDGKIDFEEFKKALFKYKEKFQKDEDENDSSDPEDDPKKN